jgi:hypothetical protein
MQTPFNIFPSNKHEPGKCLGLSRKTTILVRPNNKQKEGKESGEEEKMLT